LLTLAARFEGGFIGPYDFNRYFSLVIASYPSSLSPDAPMTPDERFERTGLELPPAPSPLGVYKPLLVEGIYCYVSGHGTVKPDGSLIKGRVGQDLTMEEGKLAARQVGLAILATLKAHLGSLNKVKRVVKVLGMVNCVSEFEKHPFVINGCSELFAEVWGAENGIGVRSAVGMGSLPDNIPVEIEAVFALH
jgi:enamine deaminase RidA (YjgF/YER057c/UK114 family)